MMQTSKNGTSPLSPSPPQPLTGRENRGLGGQLKVSHRPVMAEILHSATEHLLDEEINEAQLSQKKDSRGGSQSARGPKLGPRSSPARGAAASAKPKIGKTLEAAEVKMKETRDEDQKGIRERAERIKQIREHRFEKLLDDLVSQDELKCHVANRIREYHQREFRKQANIYSEWNHRVFGRIQAGLNRYLNPPERAKPTMEAGFSGVVASHAGGEESFRRTAEKIVAGDGSQHGESSVLSDYDPLLDGMHVDEEPEGKARSRPVLDPTHWGQLKLQATPYGHFAQAAEASAAGRFRTQLKQGNGVFIPSEKDGVKSAGKRKTRFERNNLGILKGEFASRGETIQYKRDHGGGSGAPGQDHYQGELGTKVTDKEFPLGKRMFAHMH